MANASTKEAPSNQKGAATDKLLSKEDAFLAQIFDPGKKYMFELAEPTPERHHPVIDARNNRALAHKPFKPFLNIVYTAQIVWKGQRRMVRYYDGCDSIFVDEQPKDKETMEQYVKQTQRRQFIDGKFGVYGDERMLLLYLLIASWNVESEFRTRTADVVYRPVNVEKKASTEAEKLDLIEEALELAKTATTSRMRIHADYLGIPTEDYDSGNELTEKEIRTAYRLEASRNPKKFKDSYGNNALELRFYIKKALTAGLITNAPDPNKACWKSSGRFIGDISGLKSYDAIADKLVEIAQTDDGREFQVQLLALYN